MRAPPRVLFSVLCDDVRREVGSKVSVMGIYGDAISVTEMPATLSRLSLFASCEAGDEGEDVSAALDLRGPDGKSMLSGGAVRMGPTKLGRKFNVAMGVGPVVFSKDGPHKFVLTLKRSGASLSVEHAFELVHDRG